MNRKHFIAVFCTLFACLLCLSPLAVAAESSTSVSYKNMNVAQILRDDATGREYRQTLFDGSQGGILNQGKNIMTMSTAPAPLNWNDIDTIHFDINIAIGSPTGGNAMVYDDALYTVEFVYYNNKNPLDYSKFRESFYYHGGDYRDDIFKQNVYVGLVDLDQYPNPFLNVTDEEYAANARLIRFTFDNSIYSDGTVYSKWAFFSPTGDAMKYGLAYFDVFVSYPEAEIYWLSEVFRQTTNVLSSVNGVKNILNYVQSSTAEVARDVSSLLTNFVSYSDNMFTFLRSFDDRLMSKLNGINTGIGSIATAITNAFTMSDDDEDDFNQMQQQEQQKQQQTQDKINQDKQELQQQEQVNQDKQNSVNKQEQQLQDSQQKEQDFKDQYVNDTSVKDIANSINTELAGTYGAGFMWWGNALEEILSFSPVKTMLNVVVFFSLLMMMFNSGMRHVVIGERRKHDEARRAKYTAARNPS